MRRFYTVFIKNPSVYLLGLFLFSCQKQSTEDVNILVEPGLKVERFVAEPLVMDPVAFTFDEQGRLYVVEDRGYPDPAEGGIPDKKEGRIALLQDLDDDGRYEHRSEFVGDLTYPNGIMSWRGVYLLHAHPTFIIFEIQPVMEWRIRRMWSSPDFLIPEQPKSEPVTQPWDWMVGFM